MTIVLTKTFYYFQIELLLVSILILAALQRSEGSERRRIMQS